MYASYFGLAEPPFSISPDPRFLYMSRRHREAMAHLLYGIREGGGFVQLTGEVGTGKTTLCRCLIEQVPANVDVALILQPQIKPSELLAMLCDELKIRYPDKATPKTLLDRLNAHLLHAYAKGPSCPCRAVTPRNMSDTACPWRAARGRCSLPGPCGGCTATRAESPGW
jgi:general secretion pathway protein A